MKSDYIEKSEDYITITGLEESSTNLIEEPSVLIVVRSGILKHTFPIAINKVHVALNQDLKALIPNKRFSIEYLFVLLRGVANIVLFSCSKIAATVDSIETDDLLKFLLPVPSLEEQKKIITYIETETSTIEALITKYQRQIDLMQEYRTSLISQAVTGKFDVRDWQPKTRKPSAEQWPMAITSKN
jgi:type I restriction enzyme S subunit